ncbi:MAG TPA: thiamine phosphate synthase [Dehalococcoidia bacterium]|nr:thiamine phosphate synthase [Dehalococcoidia bacterium]
MTETAPKLPTPTLMLVTDRHLVGGLDTLVRAVTEAIDGGVNVVQLREKDLPAAELLPLACRLRKVTAGRARLLVNGPLDVTLEAGADGVHLPEDAETIERPSPGFVVGRSVHSLEAARRAVEEGVDYLVAGPVYETASHPGRPAVGLEIIRKVVSISDVPVIGIGGITAENAPAVLDAGASGVAVISAILGAAAPAGRAAALWSALASPRPPVNSSLQEI